MSIVHLSEKQIMLKLKVRDKRNYLKASKFLFILQIFRSRMESDCFENELIIRKTCSLSKKLSSAERRTKFSAFTPDHNRTIIQISNLIFLFMQTPCHLPEFSSVFRSCHWNCSVGKVIIRNFEKFTRKHLCQSLFFDKVAG